MQLEKKDSKKYVKFRTDTYVRMLIYQDLLSSYQSKDNVLNFSLTITSASTAISGFTAWKILPDSYLVITTSILAFISLILNSLKTVMKYPEKIEKYKQLSKTFTEINSRFERLENDKKIIQFDSADFLGKATAIFNLKDNVREKEDPVTRIEDVIQKPKYQKKIKRLLEDLSDLVYQEQTEQLLVQNEEEGVYEH